MVLGVLGLCNVHNGEIEIATLSEYQGKCLYLAFFTPGGYTPLNRLQFWHWRIQFSNPEYNSEPTEYNSQTPEYKSDITGYNSDIGEHSSKAPEYNFATSKYNSEALEYTSYSRLIFFARFWFDTNTNKCFDIVL